MKVVLNGELLQEVECFKYLGSKIIENIINSTTGLAVL